VGLRLLQVGLLHLGAIAGAVLGSLLDDVSWVAAVIGMASGLAFGLGFVVLLDLLVRYPDGYYAWPWVRSGVRVLAVATLPLVVIASLGSSRVISVVELSGPANPGYLPALRPLSGLVVAVAMTPLVGFILLVARYRRAPSADRMQMHWPIITALVIVLGLVSSALAERILGEDVQTAAFVSAAAALPASFLIGLLRHSEEAERLVAVEASRARIAEAASTERRRIERDLHDGAQQQIVALLARIALARSKVADADPRVDQELGEISDAIQQLHLDLRELARGIHPATLTDHGLAEAVRSAMSRQPEGATLDVSPDVDGARYPSGLEEAAYLFVLEGLTNALKHSGDIHPAVRLTKVDNDLVITISDTGRGVAVDGTGKPGMTGLRDRLAAVGGRLEVESSAGLGTRLRGIFPASTRVTR
jgi:signal transduction histidine kinase